MKQPIGKLTTRREFLANSAAIGAVLGLGASASLTGVRTSFAASPIDAHQTQGCAAKHAEISNNLRHLAQEPNLAPSALSHSIKTSHCADCRTMITVDMAQVA